MTNTKIPSHRRAGSRIGPYRLEQRLSHDQSPIETWLAVDPETGQQVVVKVGPARPNPQLDEAIRNEIDLLQYLQTISGIVPFVGYATNPASLVTQFISKTTLAHIINSSWQTLVPLAHQAAVILAKVHEAGVVHRDIKPSHFPVSPDGRVFLLDFGISRLLPQPNPAPQQLPADYDFGRTLGTLGAPWYVAPEQILNGPLTTQSDVYAFAASLYHLLSGRPPFDGAKTEQVLAQHLKAEPPRLRNVPRPLSNLVFNCLEKAPDERPAMKEVQDRLGTLLSAT